MRVTIKHLRGNVLMAVVAMLTFASPAFSQQPYLNPSLSPEQRADDLLSRLTLEEKASLMMNASPAIERLGVPQFEWWSEALHGVGRNGISTVYPITMMMAASWDNQLVEKIFSAVSDEARVKNQQAKAAGNIKRYQGLSFWTPNINIYRDPRWGRGQETYGEDPYLTSMMGLAVVRGLQGPGDAKYRKLLACAKHFAVHSGPEWNRHNFNIENLPVRDLYETYLPAFKTLVDNGVEEVMCAYQRIDGDPCCGNDHFEHQILRNDWGYKGMIVSDCGAIGDFWREGCHEVSKDAASASAKAVMSGTDVECGNNYKHLAEAVARGEIKESDIDLCVRRLLVARFKVGDMTPDDQVEWTRIPASVVASDAHRHLALDIAREGTVLLQNRNNALPLQKSGQKIVVLGPNANDSVMLRGNYNGFPKSSTTILQGILDKSSDVRFIDGCPLTGSISKTDKRDQKPDVYGANEDLNANDVPSSKKVSTLSQDEILTQVADADIVVFVGGISPRVEGEEMRVEVDGFKGGDRTNIELPAVQRNLLKAIHDAGKRIVFVNCSGGAMALQPESELCDAIVQAWYAGEKGGEAVADVLFGDYNPSGKLPVTFYASSSDLPDFLDYKMEGRTYRYFHGKPLFPFGYGLSYTSFAVGKAKVAQKKVKVGSDVCLSVPVTNTGKLAGTEVLQVYINKVGDTGGAIKTLRSFVRVDLAQGETRQVAITLGKSAFEFFDSSTNTMRTVAGDYLVHYGTSSDPSDLKTVSVRLE